jgi:uroporphyrinogen-III synthase
MVKHLLVLRPENSARTLIDKLVMLGAKVTHFPISQQQAVDAPDLDGNYSGSILTSAYGVHFFKKKVEAAPIMQSLYDLPLYAVGDKTAQKARDAGFKKVFSANGDGAALAKLIIELHPKSDSPMLYPCAKNRQFDMETALIAADIALNHWVLYETIYSQNLPDALIQDLTLNRIDGILHYSAKSAENFFYLLEKHALLNHINGVKHYVLSQEISHHIPAQFNATIEIAAKPNEHEILNLIAI